MPKTSSRAQSALFSTRKESRSPNAAESFEDVMRLAGIPAFETEYQFASDRRWRFDYAWPAPWMIAFEIEGGVFGRLIVVERGYERRNGQSIPIKSGSRLRLGGRHSDAVGLTNDIEKYNRAVIDGWLLVRSTSTQVRDGYALQALRAAFSKRGLE